jgi:hypothetical protein
MHGKLMIKGVAFIELAVHLFQQISGSEMVFFRHYTIILLFFTAKRRCFICAPLCDVL